MATMQITPRLRWVQDANFNFSDPFSKPPMTLQQAWQDIETGELVWENVPVEKI